MSAQSAVQSGDSFNAAFFQRLLANPPGKRLQSRYSAALDAGFHREIQPTTLSRLQRTHRRNALSALDPAQLAQAGRAEQAVLSVFDGSYDKPDFWLNLPPHTVALVRTAKNRALKHFPPLYAGQGRHRVYGGAAPPPQAYLPLKSGWQTLHLTVRGHTRRMVYRLEGPFLRQGVAAIPLFLVVVRGQQWEKGRRHRRRLPVFYVVNATAKAGSWHLPLTPH